MSERVQFMLALHLPGDLVDCRVLGRWDLRGRISTPADWEAETEEPWKSQGEALPVRILAGLGDYERCHKAFPRFMAFAPADLRSVRRRVGRKAPGLT